MTRSRLQRQQRGDLIKLTIFLAVAALFTVWVAAVTGEVRLRDTNSYRAVFQDVSGLSKGDEVRIAGVNVGEVTDLNVQEDASVLVTFTLDSKHSLNEATTASVQYRNLIGERIIALDSADRESVALTSGGTIPITRTSSALDLDTLLNGFKPLFQGLSPARVNELSGLLIRVLQGQESAVSTLVQNVASFTGSIAEREELITGVITNLNAVVGTFDDNRDSVGALIDNLEAVVTGLESQDTELLDAAAELDTMAREATTLLSGARSDLNSDVKGLHQTAKGLNAQSDTLEALLQQLPQHYATILNTASYGNFFNFFLCGVRVQTGTADNPVVLPWIRSDVARCK